MEYLGCEFLPYLDGKTDFTSACACAVLQFYRPNTVKIPTPNVLRFAHVISNTPGMMRKTSFPCIKYRMQLRAKRVLGLGRYFLYEPSGSALHNVLLLRLNSSKQRFESSTHCCFWSGVSKRGTHFENNLRIPKDSCKIVNTTSF